MTKLVSKKIDVTDNWTAQGPNKKEQILNFDGESSDCMWHKVTTNALVPHDTQVEVSYCVGNEDIQDIGQLDGKWSEPLLNQKSVLIEASKGQRLWLKLALSAHEGKFPTVKSLRAHYSVVNYLDYLPAFYQENPLSQEFLKRYLAAYENVLQRLENQIAEVPELLDAKQTTSEFLPWLSTWVGAVKDENWPEKKWRKFLSRAAVLYKRRGTKGELEEIIKIYTGKYPVAIVERVLLRTGSVELQELFDALFGDKFSFCVLLRSRQVKNEVDRKVIKRIVEGEKPAHTVGGFVVLEDQICLDWHTYLGVNTYAVERKAEMYVGEAELSVNTVLTEG